jgi:hypothetical protein
MTIKTLSELSTLSRQQIQDYFRSEKFSKEELLEFLKDSRIKKRIC